MTNPFAVFGGIGPLAGPPPMRPMHPQPHMPPNMPPNILDPATNNQPLQFNTMKGKPPMPQHVEPDIEEELTQHDQDRKGLEEGNNLMRGAPGVSPPVGPMMAPWPPVMGPVMGDPNLMMGPMGFNQFSGFMGGNQMPPMSSPDSTGLPKEIIHIKDATLYPPPPNAPPVTTRERPPGCRTVFVGGLPENMTEEIVREIFDTCGPISGVRMSKKNFAHIRFEMQESVDKAIYYSGYRVKLGNQDDKPNTGRIHVDFAQARDDLYEWECKQRQLAREHRHQQQLEEQRLRPPSPRPIIHFSDHEASLLQEQLKGDDTVMMSTQVLCTWLDRGDCTRRTANSFYSMIQTVNSHVRRLMNEKATHDEEVELAKQKFRQRHEGLIRQFEQIDRVFQSASKQKSWDHFSKAQRKNMDTWRKLCKEICKNQQDEFLKEREEAEMEMSDSEDGDNGPPGKKKKDDASAGFVDWANHNQLKEENDSLTCQLEAYKNEVDLLKQDAKNEVAEKEKQIKLLQQAFQGMQQQLITANQQLRKGEEEAEKRQSTKGEDSEERVASPRGTTPSVTESPKTASNGTINAVSSSGISEHEGRLVGLISTFLHVHPFGASLDYICSYLQKLPLRVRTSEIEDLMERLPSVFHQDLHGVGASLEKRWRFVGFEADPRSLILL